MNHLEIERRYILFPCNVKRLLKDAGVGYESCPVEQFYLRADARGVERYRRICDRYVRTVKQGSGLVRQESETEISKEAFEAARARHVGGVIRKIRRIFATEGRRYELDSFKGVLKGLNVLEIEFSDEEEAKRFRLPEWLARAVVAEVTERPDFTNGAIARTMRIPALSTPLPELLEATAARSDFLKASVKVPLAPYESTGHALKAVLFSLLETVEANRRALLAGDEDPERLHQFRVAMRKMRALLGQMAGAFDWEWARDVRESLKALMRRTGDKRDLDVYLLEIPRYLERVEVKHRPGIRALERYLRGKVAAEEAKLEAFLRSDELARTLRQLKTFVRSEGSGHLFEVAERPLVLEAKRALKRRRAKVEKMGRAIDAHAPAHKYHELRIEVKKLRYLMEFCASLFEEEAYAVVLKRLKRLQTLLGEHQDLEVQRNHLKEFLEIPELHTPETREAIEALRSTMSRLEKEKRALFRDAFAEFLDSGGLFRTMICHF